MIEYIFDYEKISALPAQEQIATVKKNTLLMFISIIGIPAGILNLLVQGRINSDIRKNRSYQRALSVYVNIGIFGSLFTWPFFIVVYIIVKAIFNFFNVVVDAVKNIF